MADYFFHPGNADQAGEQLYGDSNKLEQLVQQIENQLNQYMSINIGNSPESYKTAMATWKAGFTEIQQALIGAKAALADITDNYVQNDLQNAANLAGAL